MSSNSSRRASRRARHGSQTRPDDHCSSTRPASTKTSRPRVVVKASRRRGAYVESKLVRHRRDVVPVICSTAWRDGSLVYRRRSSAACTPSTRRRRDEMIATRRSAMARSWPRRLWTWHASQTSAWQPRLPRQMSARFTPVRHRRVGVRCRGASRRWRAGGKRYVRERYMVRRLPEGEVAVRTPKGTDDVVAALVAAAERGREAVAHPARRHRLLGRLGQRR